MNTGMKKNESGNVQGRRDVLQGKVSIEGKEKDRGVRVTCLDAEHFGAIGRKRGHGKGSLVGRKVNIPRGEWKVALGTLVAISRKAKRWGEKLGGDIEE